MTDQIPADKVRKLVNDMRSHADHDNVRGREEEYVRHFAEQLEALLPPPPRPTLADMTDEERAACKWMQADVDGWREEGRWVIVDPCDTDGDVGAVFEGGEIEWLTPETVIPRPDLPRMTWPGTEKPAPALPDGWRLADHKDHGRVIVTNPSTSPDGDGYFYILLPTDDPRGYDWMFCPTKRLTFLDTGKKDDQ